MSSHHIALKAANVVALLLTYTTRIYFDIISSDHKERHEGNILPALYTFAIWGLINALLGGFVIYQWFESANDVTVDGIRYYHVVANIVFVIWLILWQKGLYLVDAFVFATLLAVLSLIYRNILVYPPKNLADRLFIHYPFTIYTAWAFVGTITNFWMAIRALDTVFLSTVVIIIIGLVGLFFVDIRRDIVFAATLAWYLIGVAVRQHETLSILVATSASSGLILGVILRDWVRNIINFFLHRGSANERTPLL